MGDIRNAWDLLDIITDIERGLGGKVDEHMSEPYLYDKDGNIARVRRSRMLRDAIFEFFVRDFDEIETMEALCALYGIPNIYDEEE